jgi:hypothetical protein
MYTEHWEKQHESGPWDCLGLPDKGILAITPLAVPPPPPPPPWGKEWKKNGDGGGEGGGPQVIFDFLFISKTYFRLPVKPSWEGSAVMFDFLFI